MKVLITGAGGMLGSDVAALAASMSHEVVALDRDDLDVTDPGRVERLIVRERPGAVINCAAWTNVDAAEDSEADAELVNGEGAGFVADAAAKVGATVLYPSTDYVFDGSKKGPYTESDEPNPLQAYGRTKLAGEAPPPLSTAQLHRPHLLALRPARRELRRDDAAARRRRRAGGRRPRPGRLPHLQRPPGGRLLRLIDSSAYGVHHMAGAGSCSWYEFAMEIFRQAEVVTRVMSSTTDMMARPAERPANSVLASGREVPIQLPDWKRGLADYLKRKRCAGARAAEAPRRGLHGSPPAGAGPALAR